jgi:hypothetical protein
MGGLGQADYKVMMKEIEGPAESLVELSRSEAETWAEKFKDVTRQWVKELKERGCSRQTVRAQRRVRKERRHCAGISSGVQKT